ncbi:STAS domain-containing protein [Streptomyces sp. NPDC058612]|uniref:STAS domain-containing protein n=1 Tax=Streptomyces sp. NPDC058612 TaxID=3346555 RepID=UPI00364F9C9C
MDADRTALLNAALQRAVTNPGGPTVITNDVSELGFCDSNGINVLLRAQLTAITHSRTLRLRGPNSQLLKPLNRTGPLTLFRFAPSPHWGRASSHISEQCSSPVDRARVGHEGRTLPSDR